METKILTWRSGDVTTLDEQATFCPRERLRIERHRNRGVGTRHDLPSRYPSLTIHTAFFCYPKRSDLPHTPPPHSQYRQSHSRTFLSLTSCCLCLWRRPAHLATACSTRIFYLWRRPAHLATARTIGVAYLFMFSRRRYKVDCAYLCMFSRHK